jgi:predicted  nucleic acid-binding Zn-ribbon protein
MTFVGKILVVLVTAFSLFFLAVSTVVFVTEKNWKEDRDKVKTELTKQQTKLADTTAALESATKDLEQAKADHQAQTKAVELRIAELQSRIDAGQKELTETRATAATAQETLKTALSEADARKKETELLRQQLSAVQQQSNEFKLVQTELQDQIRLLERDLESAKKSNADLRERAGAFSAELRRNGLSDDFQRIKGVNTIPPTVEGVVKRVDARNERVEISIGSDDGLVIGHELDVFRTAPQPDYLGKIRIEAVDPDQAVGVVIGKTVQGKKIQEGDNVASSIRPRG